MTDEIAMQKALDLIQDECGAGVPYANAAVRALAKFRREVSDAVEAFRAGKQGARHDLYGLVLPKPKPDPLAKLKLAISEALGEYIAPGASWDKLNATLSRYEAMEARDGS